MATAGTNGTTAALNETRAQATRQDVENARARGDWRVRLALAPNANYFYRAQGQQGILAPLAATDGVIFPYTPTVSVNYTAAYAQDQLTHSNFKAVQYTGSAIDNVTLGCDFTAQDTYEANYLLATIHFFKSLTKMFYGQDQNPARGTPPPMCYLFGYGDFGFDKHPLVITGFTYNLPNDVDYIRTNTTSFTAGQPLYTTKNTDNGSISESRRRASGPPPEAAPIPFTSLQVRPTYVPTRIALQVTAIPAMPRYEMSNKFSLKDYASGQLLLGRKNSMGGVW